jgi:hypothetical protein
MKEKIDYLMWMLYSSSISVLDVLVAIIIGAFGGWFWILFVLWFFYSSKQKIKYDGV